MPRNKDFKRVVRQRMKKTGESYTAARANLLRKTATPAASITPEDYAQLTGKADDTMKAKTGRDWAKWVYVLDRVKAHEWPHRDIAQHVAEEYGLSGWWAQMVTVGYERIRGLRAKGQRRGGAFEVSKTRTFDVPVSRLFRAFRDERTRTRWLDADVDIRTATPDKSMRMGWPDGTTVAIWFIAKGDAKTQVAVQHMKLPDAAAAEKAKAYWAERLAVLKEVLT